METQNVSPESEIPVQMPFPEEKTETPKPNPLSAISGMPIADFAKSQQAEILNMLAKQAAFQKRMEDLVDLTSRGFNVRDQMIPEMAGYIISISEDFLNHMLRENYALLTATGWKPDEEATKAE